MSSKTCRPTRLPAKIHPLHNVRQITGFTQEQFAQRIGISTPLLRNIELGQRPITSRAARAIYLLTGIDPVSWSKKTPFSTLGRKFDAKTYNLWKMVSQDENEAAPKRVTGRRVKALELIGQAMARGEKGIVWEEDFRQFLAEVVKRYNLEAPLQEIKRELEKRGEVWPEEAFSAPKEVAKRATAAAAMLKFSN
jgi:transcriptional regulator with XRE-family HTH domain